MDQHKFVELLQTVQIPDTEKVKAAERELRKTYYPHPESLLWLLQLLTSHDVQQIRQQAAVEALRLVPKHWVSLPANQKPAIRQSLLQSTLNESNTLVRHSSARVISAIAKIDLEDGEWVDLPGLLAQAAQSKEVQHREVGVYILFTLLETVGDGFSERLPSLFNLFRTTIKDAESAEVRITTMLALSRVAMMIEPDEDPKNVESFRQVFPDMVAVLRGAIDANDEDRIMQAFEVFQTLLGCEAALMANHFKDLIQFMLEVASETSLPEETRTQALSFLMQSVRYRRMKIQAMNVGEQLTTKAMEIVAEMDDDDDDEDDITPARSALGLLDLLAEGLPPRQVVVPLLKALPQYIRHTDPKYRKAGILALSMCVEGAPDFIAIQLPEIMPVVLNLLNDTDIKVRHAALQGVSRLADDLAEDMSKEHEKFIPALINNLDSSSTSASNEAEQKTKTDMMIGSCLALDSLVDGMDSDMMSKYISELVPRLGRLFSHPDPKVKAAAASAMGSVAASAEAGFMPYFEATMKALSEYVSIKDSDEELTLRGTVCDAMGSIATAVGAEAFKPYVQPLMQASEEALHLDHPRLRETSYILWSTLVKIYDTDFTPFLEGVVKGLIDCLEQEESELEVELGEEASDLLGKEVVIAGKKVKVAAATDEIEDVDPMEGAEDDDDWDDLVGVTAVGLEKEIAVEVLGDVLAHSQDKFLPYLEKTVEVVLALVDHSYEGVRKGAIGTLWRGYASLWGMMEKHTGKKWQPGLPLKEQPTAELVKLGEVITSATLGVWGNEVERSVVTDINRNIAETLKLCGPAILTHAHMVEQVTSTLTAIVTRQHPCQLDLGDEEDQGELQESSEYDWLVIDTALDVLTGLASALGPQFSELWKIFEKPIMKFASSQDSTERSTSMGVIAEAIGAMGSDVTPYTSTMLKVLLHRLSDSDVETSSNAAYATGLLIANSTNTAAYLSSYSPILAKLEPLLQTDRAGTIDNAAGCVSRMILKHPDKVPLEEVLPVLVDILPLKDDYAENKPIYECILALYKHGNPTIQELTPQLVPVLASVVGEPADQLPEELRGQVVELLRFILRKKPELVQGNEMLGKILGGQ